MSLIETSIVIPTFQRCTQLQRTLASIELQTIPLENFEVIVIVDGVNDDSQDYLASYKGELNLRWYVQENAGPSAARNKGIAEAIGRMIVFVDDDVVPEPHFLQAHIGAHNGVTGEAAIFGPLNTPPGTALQSWSNWEQDQLAAKYARLNAGELLPNPHLFYTGNASVARKTLQAVGGFDERIKRAEDLELAYRLQYSGCAIHFCPEATAFHYLQRSWSNWIAIPYHYGRNTVWFAKELGHRVQLETVVESYHSLHVLNRLLISIALDRTHITKVFTFLLKAFVNIPVLNKYALSAIYSLYRFQGIADGLGGKNILANMIADC